LVIVSVALTISPEIELFVMPTASFAGGFPEDLIFLLFRHEPQLNEPQVDGAPSAPLLVQRKIPSIEMHRRKLVHESDLDSTDVLPVFPFETAILLLHVPRIPDGQAAETLANVRRQIRRPNRLEHLQPLEAMKHMPDARRSVPELV